MLKEIRNRLSLGGTQIKEQKTVSRNILILIEWTTVVARIIFFDLEIVGTGNILHLSSVTPENEGAYFCIASNGYPPSVSRAFNVKVLRECTEFLRCPPSYILHSANARMDVLFFQKSQSWLSLRWKFDRAVTKWNAPLKVRLRRKIWGSNRRVTCTYC